MCSKTRVYKYNGWPTTPADLWNLNKRKWPQHCIFVLKSNQPKLKQEFLLVDLCNSSNFVLIFISENLTWPQTVVRPVLCHSENIECWSTKEQIWVQIIWIQRWRYSVKHLLKARLFFHVVYTVALSCHFPTSFNMTWVGLFAGLPPALLFWSTTCCYPSLCDVSVLNDILVY